MSHGFALNPLENILFMRELHPFFITAEQGRASADRLSRREGGRQRQQQARSTGGKEAAELMDLAGSGPGLAGEVAVEEQGVSAHPRVATVRPMEA
jgi:hypothetical protein